MRILFVGAHPDDIEIGAGALAARLIRDGEDVRFLVLTTHPSDGAKREEEARASAAVLGLPPTALLFARFPDGQLSAYAPEVSSVRSLFLKDDWQPQVVIAHTSQDSHNDHVSANSVARAAFRSAVLLFYSVHVSAELHGFTPQFYCSVNGELAAIKSRALSEHRSQRFTIERSDLLSYEVERAQPTSLPRVEAFEVEFQSGAPGEVIDAISAYNDSAFHSLWSRILGTDTLYLLHEDFQNYPIDSFEAQGRAELRNAFSRKWIWPPARQFPVAEEFSNDPRSQDVLRSSTVLIAGGAVSNTVYRNTFIRMPGVDWVIEFETPSTADAFVMRRSTGERILTESDAYGLVSELSILTIMRNPFAVTKWLVSCAGAHGAGTRALLRLLAAPEVSPMLVDVMEQGFRQGGVQVVTKVDPRTMMPVAVVGDPLFAWGAD